MSDNKTMIEIEEELACALCDVATSWEDGGLPCRACPRHRVCRPCFERGLKIFGESKARGFRSEPNEDGEVFFEYPLDVTRCFVCKFPIRQQNDPVANEHFEHSVLLPTNEEGTVLPCPCIDCEEIRQRKADDEDYERRCQQGLHDAWESTGRIGECQCTPCVRARPCVPFPDPPPRYDL